jgi:hypothetical protein
MQRTTIRAVDIFGNVLKLAALEIYRGRPYERSNLIARQREPNEDGVIAREVFEPFRNARWTETSAPPELLRLVAQRYPHLIHQLFVVQNDYGSAADPGDAYNIMRRIPGLQTLINDDEIQNQFMDGVLLKVGMPGARRLAANYLLCSAARYDLDNRYTGLGIIRDDLRRADAELPTVTDAVRAHAGKEGASDAMRLERLRDFRHDLDQLCIEAVQRGDQAILTTCRRMLERNPSLVDLDREVLATPLDATHG